MKSTKKNPNTMIEDERTESVGNKYGFHAFVILSAYVFLSIVLKPFIFDIHPLFYWDYGVIMIVAYLYMNYRMGREGVAMEPVVNPIERNFWPIIFKVWFPIGLLFGSFIIFWVVPQVENWATFFSGMTEKTIGVVVISALFCIIMTIVLFLMDTIPGNWAKKQAEQMLDDSTQEERESN